MSDRSVPYTARLLNPAHPDLANAAGVPARLANEAYVESLARIVYYWAYPLVDAFGRTSAKGEQSTRVSSRFEQVNDAVGPGIPFLRKMARAASEEILEATLDGRAVNEAQLQEQLKVQAAKDPQLMARGYMEASGQMYKEIQETGGTFSEISNKP